MTPSVWKPAALSQGRVWPMSMRGTLVARALSRMAAAAGLAALLSCGGGGSSEAPAGSGGSTGRFSSVASMGSARDRPSAVLLGDGKVLVAGGRLGSGSLTATTEFFDPASSTWSPGPSMAVARWLDFLVRLPDGRVLAIAGDSTSTRVEFFDPATRVWRDTTPLPRAVTSGTRTLLRDGRVLVIPGGIAPALIFDPATMAWTTSTAKPDARQNFTANELSDGRILVVGGCLAATTCLSSLLSTAQLFVPSSGAWSSAGTLFNARMNHLAVTLADGRVLVSHGSVANSSGPTSEVYTPSTGTWSAAGAILKFFASTVDPTSTRLLDGRVLVAGGATPNGARILDQVSISETNAEVFDPATGNWGRATAPGAGLVVPRVYHTATRLGDGRVLIAGGMTGATASDNMLSSAELFVP